MTDEVQLIKQEIEKRLSLLWDLIPEGEKVLQDDFTKEDANNLGKYTELESLLQFIDSLREETKPQFPNYESVVDKVFGAGNLESWEYGEAEKLVLLAKEELLKDLKKDKEPASEYLEEEYEKYFKKHEIDIVLNPYTNCKDIASHFAEWQKEKDYKMYAHVPLKDVHDAWQELKKNKSDIEKYPAVCFQKGTDWRENQMKEALQTEYEKGRFDMREEMLKDALNCSIIMHPNDRFANYSISVYVPPLHPASTYISNGDKVKIVIIKTEQQ